MNRDFNLDTIPWVVYGTKMMTAVSPDVALNLLVLKVKHISKSLFKICVIVYVTLKVLVCGFHNVFKPFDYQGFQLILGV